MQTQTLSQFDPNRFFQQLPAGDSQAGSMVNAQVEAVQASIDFSGTVSVMTAEGDKVTFSADREVDYRYTNYEYSAQSGDRSLEVDGMYAESSLSQTLGLTVEGDLSEQEVADLTKLFKIVKNIFRKFFRGQDEQALAKTVKLAENFGNFSTLAGLDLSADVTRSVTAQAAQLTTQQPAEPVALPFASGEGNGGSLTPQQTTSGGTPATVAAPLQMTPSAQDRELSPKPLSLTEQVLKALKDSRIDDAKLQKYLPGLLRKAASHDGGHEAVQKITDLIKEILEAIQKKTDEQVAPSQEVQISYYSLQRTSATLSVRA